MARIGPPQRHVTLSAPVGVDQNWHGIETASDGTRFRWTRSACISWPLPPSRAAAVEVRIPFIMEVAPNFAANCHIEAAEKVQVTYAADGSIVALIEALSDPASEVRLLTPEPVSPRQVRGAPDDRLLGLAVPVGG
jgi:hypothetical protein